MVVVVGACTSEAMLLAKENRAKERATIRFERKRSHYRDLAYDCKPKEWGDNASLKYEIRKEQSGNIIRTSPCLSQRTLQHLTTRPPPLVWANVCLER